jgi:hypothetical protein
MHRPRADEDDARATAIVRVNIRDPDKFRLLIRHINQWALAAPSYGPWPANTRVVLLCQSGCILARSDEPETMPE